MILELKPSKVGIADTISCALVLPIEVIMSDNTKVIGRYQTSRDCTKRDEIIIL